MIEILQGDCLDKLKELPTESVDCVMTSPPYWALRDYGTGEWEGGDDNCDHIDKTAIGGQGEKSKKQHTSKGTQQIQFKEVCGICGAKRVDKQLGLEPTFHEYINRLCNIFDEVKRVLKKEGTCWVNIGDTYGGSGKGATKNNTDRKKTKESWNFRTKPRTEKTIDKTLCQIPSRFSIEMTNRGWILRNEIIWHKPNCMPSSVKDRFTVDFEKIFFFVKSKKYWFETQFEETKAKMKRNKRAVWKISTKPFKEAHFAVFPPELCETPLKAGCPIGGVVLDPFMGSGTTGVVSVQQNKNFIGIELNSEYIKIAEKRIQDSIPKEKELNLFFEDEL